MPNIKKITLPSGTTYDIVDQGGRDLIAELMNYNSYLGVTTTILTEGSTTNPIMIGGQSVTAEQGDVATYNKDEFIFNKLGQWQLFGNLSGLGGLAYKNSATAKYTPIGVVESILTGTELTSEGKFTPAGALTINQYTPTGGVESTFTGTQTTSTGDFTPSGSVEVTTKTTEDKTALVKPAASGDATYTPAGIVAAPIISVGTAGTTTTVNSITDVGTLPTLTTSVANETLTISFEQGTLPTKGANTTVKTGDAAYTASAPVFTGTGARLTTEAIAVPNAYEATFTGASGAVSVTGTPAGSVISTFTGDAETLTGTFTGTEGDVSVKGTPSGTIESTFTGTEATITAS